MDDVENVTGSEETTEGDEARAGLRPRTALTFLICLVVCLAAYLVGFSYEHAEAERKADSARNECPLPGDGWEDEEWSRE